MSADIDPLDPLCTGETVTCFAALQSVGNFQIGTNVPPELEDLDEDIHLDVDKVQVVPEPAAALQLVACAGTLVALGRRRARNG